MMKQWAKREMQIERVIGSTAGLYGDLQGIAGTSCARWKVCRCRNWNSAKTSSRSCDVLRALRVDAGLAGRRLP
jgi:hypothetical protein